MSQNTITFCLNGKFRKITSSADFSLVKIQFASSFNKLQCRRRRTFMLICVGRHDLEFLHKYSSCLVKRNYYYGTEHTCLSCMSVRVILELYSIPTRFPVASLSRMLLLHKPAGRYLAQDALKRTPQIELVAV